MNQFANALGKKFVENQELVRTRSFEMGGHTFKVRVPTTLEYEAMHERIKVIDESMVDVEYAQIAKVFIDRKADFEKESNIEFAENDVIIEGRSLKETAKNKILTQMRITEFFKLLVPEDKEFDMNTITYPMIEELFPFAIQIELIDEINKVISANYKDTKGK